MTKKPEFSIEREAKPKTREELEAAKQEFYEHAYNALDLAFEKGNGVVLCVDKGDEGEQIHMVGVSDISIAAFIVSLCVRNPDAAKLAMSGMMKLANEGSK